MARNGLNISKTWASNMIDLQGEEGPTPHQPVLYHESLTYLQVQSGERFVDGTLGAGDTPQAF